jgi:hypothetical protein
MSKTFFVHVLDRRNNPAKRDQFKTSAPLAAPETPNTKNLKYILGGISNLTAFKGLIPVTLPTTTTVKIAKLDLLDSKEKRVDVYKTNNKCNQNKKFPAYVVNETTASGTTPCYGIEGSETSLTNIARDDDTGINAAIPTSTDPWAANTPSFWLIKIEIPGSGKFPWDTASPSSDDSDSEDEEEDEKDEDDLTFWLLLGGSLLLACLAIIFAVLFMYM